MTGATLNKGNHLAWLAFERWHRLRQQVTNLLLPGNAMIEKPAWNGGEEP
jgi:hypothetical protein